MLKGQRGASLAEFLVAAPLVLLIGMATLQAGLIYHGKTTLNYAVFEAARTGATHNAQVAVMRDELGQRLAPVKGGDTSLEHMALSIAESVVDANDATTTQLRILNPTPAAFDDWGLVSPVTQQRIIPNAHLRHKSDEIGFASGLTIQDANLLKIRVVYGLDLKVPVVGELIAEAMQIIDVKNSHYYHQKKFPLSAVATVRMQSDAWESEVLASIAPSIAPQSETNGTDEGDQEDIGEVAPENPTDAGTPTMTDCADDEFGLGGITELINTADYVDQQCVVSTHAFTPTNPQTSVTSENQADCA
ncbi:MAG: TadE/TadG family type IV pilus assembly protein [Granulosicoccus sp.]